jgi:hypothetical protein
MPDHRQERGDRRRLPVHPRHLPRGPAASRRDHVRRNRHPPHRRRQRRDRSPRRPHRRRRREFSPFEELHGFSIDGVDLSTSALPTGWRGRLVKVQNANTAAPDGEPQFTGWCLDKEDLCAAKLCALREKDRNFVAALARSELVDPETILSRLTTVDERYRRAAEVAASWLRSLKSANWSDAS